jgi:hypothetical protein
MVDVHRFYRLEQVLPQSRLPLMRIYKIVDSAVGCEMMVLLDYFLGYHQIWLHKEDKEKTSFITLFRKYYYLRVLKCLCNVGPTFCRMTNVALKDQVRRNVLSYVDDIVIANKKGDAYISDLAETFMNTREAKLKFNLENAYSGLQGARSSGV